MKMFTRSLGTAETESPDFTSMLMFEPNYLRVLMELGERDIEGRLPELIAFLGIESTHCATP